MKQFEELVIVLSKNKENYFLLFQKQISTLSLSDNKPSLLLHACCAPCSSYVLELLQEHFNISIFYYNPNIYPETEYNRRLEELLTFLKKSNQNLSVITPQFDENQFYESIDIKNHPEFQNEKEMGERCRKCYRFRLEKTAIKAKELQYDYFTTTLSISPFKDAQKINREGKLVEAKIEELYSKEKNPLFLYGDFKKKGGFQHSLEISKEYGLYRQEYCGCIFSMKNR